MSPEEFALRRQEFIDVNGDFLFSRYDTNHDGFMEEHDFTLFLRDLWRMIERRENSLTESKCWKEADHEGKGRLDSMAFRRAIDVLWLNDFFEESTKERQVLFQKEPQEQAVEKNQSSIQPEVNCLQLSEVPQNFGEISPRDAHEEAATEALLENSYEVEQKIQERREEANIAKEVAEEANEDPQEPQATQEYQEEGAEETQEIQHMQDTQETRQMQDAQEIREDQSAKLHTIAVQNIQVPFEANSQSTTEERQVQEPSQKGQHPEGQLTKVVLYLQNSSPSFQTLQLGGNNDADLRGKELTKLFQANNDGKPNSPRSPRSPQGPLLRERSGSWADEMNACGENLLVRVFQDSTEERYKTLMVSPETTAQDLLLQALLKYQIPKELVGHYFLVEISDPEGNARPILSTAPISSLNPSNKLILTKKIVKKHRFSGTFLGGIFSPGGN